MAFKDILALNRSIFYASSGYEKLFSNLSPWPPSLAKGRGSISKRGAKPLSKISSLSFKGESKRGEASLISLIPLPLIKGKGIKGMGLLKDKGSEVNKQSLSDRDILKLYNDMEYIGG